MVAIDSDPLLTKAEKAQQKQSLYIAYSLNGTLGSHSLATTVSPLSSSFYPNDTVESVVGKLISTMKGRLGSSFYFHLGNYYSFLLHFQGMR